MDRYIRRLASAETLSDIFEIVKAVVRESLGRERAGLMLGLAELGGAPGQMLGAYYPVASNIIVVNKSPLRRLQETRPDLYNPYTFHVLLHEYLHSLGFLSEEETRRWALAITKRMFGDDHPATAIAQDIHPFMPYLTRPYGDAPRNPGQVELVRDFDRGSVTYIH